MDEHKVERTDEGDAIVLKTDAYRLAITNGNFAFLTDISTGPGAGCTCHLRETWDIQNLRALLDEAEKILQARELADAKKDFDEGFDAIPFPNAADENPSDFEDDEEEDVCDNCGAARDLVIDTPFCKECYDEIGDGDDDWEEEDFWEDPNEAIVPGSLNLLGEDEMLDEDDPDLENWYDE